MTSAHKAYARIEDSGIVVESDFIGPRDISDERKRVLLSTCAKAVVKAQIEILNLSEPEVLKRYAEIQSLSIKTA
jgi:hypothetical protein